MPGETTPGAEKKKKLRHFQTKQGLLAAESRTTLIMRGTYPIAVGTTFGWGLDLVLSWRGLSGCRARIRAGVGRLQTEALS